ncbi:MAG: FtsX-like permease family protein [Dehalococcoidia bacterium]|nr:FtsX-like permease family protein [Dehalococcoidia bacterium]
MRNILPIVSANLRKGKSQALSLIAFAIIAALLLNIGLLLMLNFGHSFEKHAEELNTPHYVLIQEKRLYTQEQFDYINNYPGVIETETENALGFITSIPFNNGEIMGGIICLNTSNPRNMNDFELIEGAAPQGEKGICLPYLFKVGGGLKVGDDFILNCSGSEYTFIISGFTEEIMFGSPNNGVYQTYISQAGYDAFLEQEPAAECVIVRVRMANLEDGDKLLLDSIKKFYFEADIEGADSAFITSISWSLVKSVRTMMSGITSTIMIIFAVLIVIISLLVVRFRISNSIEESVMNIGSLKSVGYTGTQLLWATILQFCSISAIGILAGIGLSYAALPFISSILEAQTALIWRQPFDITTSLITFGVILIAVLFVTLLSTMHIRKLHPLTALRQGFSANKYKRNHFELANSKGPQALLLATKSAMQNMGQMLMTFIIVAIAGFAAASAVSIYDNIGNRPETFAKLIAGEVPDAAFFVRDANDTPYIREYIENQNGVRKVFYYNNLTIMINDTLVGNYVCDDFSQVEGTMLYGGRYPQDENEIVISGKLAQMQNKGVGDSIEIAQGSSQTTFVVVGLIQTMNDNGYACSMTEAGMRRIQSDYLPRGIYVYLYDSAKTVEHLEIVKNEFGTKLESSINLWELMDAQLSVYGSIFRMVAIAIFMVTMLVIMMTLYLMMKTAILRQRREIGIQKAMGFTTGQLMNQFAMLFIPVIALGVVVGGLVGILGFNSIFVALVSGMGIMTASLPAPIFFTIAICGSLILVSYAFAMLIAWRIRKISAYALVSE